VTIIGEVLPFLDDWLRLVGKYRTPDSVRAAWREIYNYSSVQFEISQNEMREKDLRRINREIASFKNSLNEVI